jgi:hypothetical protein
MKKHLLFYGNRGTVVFFSVVFYLLLFLNLSGYSQTLSSISAASGSFAPWGEIQGLSLDASGNATVFSKNLDTGVAQTSTILLTPTQMQAITDTAVIAGFFSLSPLYSSSATDGSGITLEINTSAASNTVEIRNVCLTAINRVVKTINQQILSSGIQLNYGYLNEVCP